MKLLIKLLKLLTLGKIPKHVTAEIKYLAPNQKLIGKKIIVTGASRGIGLAMAKRFKDEGADVLITGRNEDSLREACETIGCKYLTLDMLDTNSFDSFIQNAEKVLGKIDCLVNNAGVSLHEKSFFDVTKDSFDNQINTNFRGPFFLTQSFVKHLLSENRTGNVLFLSSETGITVDIRPYGYTKAAINSMVQGLASLLAPRNIRVNAIAPGITATEMTGYSGKDNLYCLHNMNERAYLPGEIAEVATFLLSDVSGCISGQIVVCNNGRTINSRVKK